MKNARKPSSNLHFHEKAAACQQWHCRWPATVGESAPPHFHPHSDWAAFAARCTLGSEPSRVLSSRWRALSAQVKIRSHPDGAVRGFSFCRLPLAQYLLISFFLPALFSFL